MQLHAQTRSDLTMFMKQVRWRCPASEVDINEDTNDVWPEYLHVTPGGRAMVELRRALQENSIVREPLLNARYEKEEVSGVRTREWCADPQR